MRSILSVLFDFPEYASIKSLSLIHISIPVQQAFIRLVNGETHHVQRKVVPKNATIIAYGEIGDEEREVFEKLVSRNAHNMCFEKYRIVYTTEEKLEEIVMGEVKKWEA